MFDSLAAFVCGLTAEAMPPGICREAAFCILDTVGCMAAGSATEDAAKLLAVEARMGAGPCTVIGATTSLSAAAAARVNGYMGDIFEVNDLIGGHASIGIVSAALAIAEQAGAGGVELLDAVVCGIEVTARLYNAFYPLLKGYEQCGMVSVGLPSSVGAAASCARLLGLSEHQTVHAMAMAGALAGWCPAEVIFGDGGSVKPMLFGAWPATAGITAACYAQAGMTGPRDLLESKIGYFATIAHGYDAGAITPETWSLAAPRRKLHACCGYIHAALDAMIMVRRDAGLMAEDVSEIEVELPPYIIPAVVKTRLPVSANDARFHLSFCLAITAAGSDAILPRHSEAYVSEMARPGIADLMRGVRVVASARFTHYHQALVRVVTHAGTVMEAAVTAPKGSPGNPLSEAALESKFHSLAGSVFADSATIRDKILSLDGSGDLRPLFDALRAGRGHCGPG